MLPIKRGRKGLEREKGEIHVGTALSWVARAAVTKTMASARELGVLTAQKAQQPRVSGRGNVVSGEDSLLAGLSFTWVRGLPQPFPPPPGGSTQALPLLMSP